MADITASMVKELRERTGAAMMACKKALDEAKGNMDAAIDILRKAGEAKAAKRAGKIAAEGIIEIAVDAAQKQAFLMEINCETDFVARDENFKTFAKMVARIGLAKAVKDVNAVLSVPFGTSGSETIDDARKTLVNKIGENIQIRRVAFLSSDGIVGHYCHGHRIGVLVALDRNEPELAKDIAMHIAASNPQSISADDVPAAVIERERQIYLEQAKGSGKSEEIIKKMVAGRVSKFLNENSLIGQLFVKDSNTSVGDLLKARNVKVLAFVRCEVGEGIDKETQNFADEVMAQVQGRH